LIGCRGRFALREHEIDFDDDRIFALEDRNERLGLFVVREVTLPLLHLVRAIAPA
jgi:hypothetical protein